MTSPRRPVARRIPAIRIKTAFPAGGRAGVVVALERLIKKHDETGSPVARARSSSSSKRSSKLKSYRRVNGVGDRPAMGPGDWSGQAPHDLHLLQQQRFQNLRAHRARACEMRGRHPAMRQAVEARTLAERG